VLLAVGVDRQGLAAFLVDEAARRYPNAITFHFDVKPELDLQQRTVRLTSGDSNAPSGSARELPYDLLVGADGAGSSVRAALEQAVQDISVSMHFVSSVQKHQRLLKYRQSVPS
jgi:2-polyprenyl-6-methoxyphenol hydroxylase-like FAD-dependent oxidoreductase